MLRRDMTKSWHRRSGYEIDLFIIAPSASSLASSALHPLRLRRLLAALPSLRLRFLLSLRRLRPSPPPLFTRFGCDGSSPPCLRCDFVSSCRSVGFVPRLLRSSP